MLIIKHLGKFEFIVVKIMRDIKFNVKKNCYCLDCCQVYLVNG